MFPKDDGVFLGLKVHEHYDSGAQNTPSPLREIENFEKSSNKILIVIKSILLDFTSLAIYQRFLKTPNKPFQFNF